MAMTVRDYDPAIRMPAGPTMAGAAALALFGLLWAAAMSLMSALMAARLLGISGFGLFRLGLSVVTVATAVASGGLHNALLTLIPKRDTREGQAAVTLGGAAWPATAVAGVLAIAIIIWRTPLAAALGDHGAGGLLAAMALSLPFLVLLAAVGAASRAAFAFTSAIIPGQIIRPALFTLSLVAALAWGMRSPVTVAWLFTGAAAAAAWIAGVAVSRVESYGTAWLRPTWRLDRDLVVLMTPLLGLAILQSVHESLPVWQLGRQSTASALGLYAAAERMAFLVAAILAAVNTVYAPAISVLWARAERDVLRDSFQRAARWTLLASIPVCLLLIFAGPGLLRAFGVEYQVAVPALTLLALGQMVNAGTGSVGYLLLLTGHARTVIWHYAAAVALLAALGAVLVPRYGPTGAAGAAALVIAGLNLAMVVQAQRRLRIVPFTRATLRILAAGLVGAGAGVVAARWAWGGTAAWPIGLAGTTAAVLGAYAAAAAGFLPDEDRVQVRKLWMVLRRRSQP